MLAQTQSSGSVWGQGASILAVAVVCESSDMHVTTPTHISAGRTLTPDNVWPARDLPILESKKYSRTLERPHPLSYWLTFCSPRGRGEFRGRHCIREQGEKVAPVVREPRELPRCFLAVGRLEYVDLFSALAIFSHTTTL